MLDRDKNCVFYHGSSRDEAIRNADTDRKGRGKTIRVIEDLEPTSPKLNFTVQVRTRNLDGTPIL